MGKSTRKSQTLLPEVFQTTKNKDFLTATLDQLTEPAKTQKLSQYVGHTTLPSYKATDAYVPELTVITPSGCSSPVKQVPSNKTVTCSLFIFLLPYSSRPQMGPGGRMVSMLSPYCSARF